MIRTLRTSSAKIIQHGVLFIITVVFVGLITNQLVAFGQNGEGERPALVISALLSKQTVKPGEKIWLACMIYNQAAESLILRPEIYPYPVGYLRILNSNRVEMKEYVLPPLYSPKLGRESFIEVEPGQQIAITFEPKIEWQPLPTLLGDQKKTSSDTGLFFGFWNASILLDEDDRYFLQCEFEQKEDEWIDGRKRFGFQNVWVGKIVSEPVELRIQR
ncbi:MAG: hypothetical protein MPW16_20240 [Candidatus Manganitrophus sp.]|nr:MAG: hypothetical protein MPW16_20240 [Candidatus Manganitrophus sp.]